MQRLFADAHRVTRKCLWWVVGGVGVGTTTHPATHSPTYQQKLTCNHPPTMQGLFDDAHRLTSKCWWWIVLVVVGATSPCTDRRTQYQPTHPPATHTHPATIQGFCADTHRLTVKTILRPNARTQKNRRTTNNAVAVRSLTTSRRLSRCSCPIYLS